MRRFIFTGILVTLALFSKPVFGQVTSFGCEINPSAFGSAVGYQTKALGKYSLASGYMVRAMADQSYIFGTTQTGNILHSGDIVANNTQRSFLILFEGKPVFFARLVPPPLRNDGDEDDGESEGEEDRDIGYPDTYYTGTPAVGIGTIDPRETLDVRGNIIADTVKINKSIFLPENELLFTYYQPSTDGGGGEEDDDEPPIIERMEGDSLRSDFSNVKPMMTLKRVGYDNRLGIGSVAPEQSLHVKGNGLFTGRLNIGTPTTDYYFARLEKLKLQVGELWTFFNMTDAKIMGYNCLFMSTNSPSRRVDGFASAIMMRNSGLFST